MWGSVTSNANRSLIYNKKKKRLKQGVKFNSLCISRVREVNERDRPSLELQALRTVRSYASRPNKT